MGEYYHKDFQCPFLLKTRKRSISCELGDIRFPSQRPTIRYLDRFCANADYGLCTLAAAANEIYDRKEDQNGEETDAGGGEDRLADEEGRETEGV